MIGAFAGIEDVYRYTGTLIIFIRPIQKITPHYDPMATRFTDEQLDEMDLKSIGLLGRASSSPALGTIIITRTYVANL